MEPSPAVLAPRDQCSPDPADSATGSVAAPTPETDPDTPYARVRARGEEPPARGVSSARPSVPCILDRLLASVEGEESARADGVRSWVKSYRRSIARGDARCRCGAHE